MKVEGSKNKNKLRYKNQLFTSVVPVWLLICVFCC